MTSSIFGLNYTYTAAVGLGSALQPPPVQSARRRILSSAFKCPCEPCGCSFTTRSKLAEHLRSENGPCRPTISQARELQQAGLERCLKCTHWFTKAGTQAHSNKCRAIPDVVRVSIPQQASPAQIQWRTVDITAVRPESILWLRDLIQQGIDSFIYTSRTVMPCASTRNA